MVTPAIIVSGPTASGKSRLAMELAQEFSGEIINSDSMQVYKELRILTARPSRLDEQKIPHHLYGHIGISDRYSAGKWLNEAGEKLIQIKNGGNLPIICGGTGLYIKVLQEGISPIPNIPDNYIKKANTFLSKVGGTKAIEQIRKADPSFALRLHPNDKQRIVRTLSVMGATGKSLTDWQKLDQQQKIRDINYFIIHLIPQRETLYKTIEIRFQEMLKAGAMDEVKMLMPLELNPLLPALKAVGVPELTQVLKGKIALADASLNAQRASRNLAKRQLTWLRNQVVPAIKVPDFANKETIIFIKKKVRSYLQGF